ncbi:hypothetical protein EV424DRAFT_1342955 [Suillus variegatus]|nr:hypothetical protein EV424DRAFT_1342955 [Suillus variegatus]
MEPANPSPFSNLPIEIALIVFTYAAKPTFSQEEKYDDKNPYSTAVSLCLVSQLVRRTILPEFLHTILLRRPNSVNMFENALRMQKAYAEKESDLVFDYISAIKRMWIDDLSYRGNSQFSQDMDVLVPVILATPALAINSYQLLRVMHSVQNAWDFYTGPNVSGHSPFPGKPKSLTLTDLDVNSTLFHSILRGFIFLTWITHITCLADLQGASNSFCDTHRGLLSPEHPLRIWIRAIPWAWMKDLETFSIVYPHLTAHYDNNSYIDRTRGVDVHVERFTVPAAPYKQNPPNSRSWMAVLRSVKDKKKVLDGLSFKVARDQTHLTQVLCSWDKAWASGLIDG